MTKERGLWLYLVGSVRGHGGCEDNGALDPELDEGTGSGARGVECTEEVDVEQGLNILLGEVKGGLMVGTPGVDDHAVEGTGLFDDLINRSGDGGFFGYIGGDSEQLAGKALGHGSEIVSSLANVDGVDLCCAIGKAALGDTETDSAVGTSDCGWDVNDALIALRWYSWCAY